MSPLHLISSRAVACIELLICLVHSIVFIFVLVFIFIFVIVFKSFLSIPNQSQKRMLQKFCNL